MLNNIICVALGGALGSVCRYLVSKWLQEAASVAFPVGTLAVNVLGCLLIGIFYAMAERHGMGGSLKLLLTVGFCGGFTTFSTFMNENLTLLRSDQLLTAAMYAAASVALGLIAVWAGMKVCG